MITFQGTKECPKCERRMIKAPTGVCLMTSPVQYPWDWWCACGHTEEGGVEREATIEEERRKRWEKAQKECGA